jgi:type I restriction enzyme S subunit
MAMERNDLPEGWEWKKLGDKKYSDIIMGQSPPSNTYNLNGVGLPFFQGKAEFGVLYPVVKKYCSIPNRIAVKDDVLISVRAPVGPTNLANQKCCIGRGLAAIRCKENVLPLFLLLALRNIESDIAASVQDQGGGFTAIKREQLENVEIPIPPLPEQRRIVKRIKELTLRVEEASKVRITALQEIENIIQAAITAVFKDKGNWVSLPFEKAVRRIKGRGMKLKTGEYRPSGAFPIVDQGQSQITGYTNNNNAIFKCSIPVIVFGDHTKNIKYIDFDFAVGADGVILLRPTDDIIPKFFYFWLKSIPLHSLGYSRHYKLLKEQIICFP